MAQMKTGFGRHVNAFVLLTANYTDVSDWGSDVSSSRTFRDFQFSILDPQPTDHWSLVTFLELPLVIRGVEVAFRFRDQSVVVDLPKFVAADSNFISSATGSGVSSG